MSGKMPTDLLDLDSLNERERDLILQVLKRDDRIRRMEEARIFKIKQDINQLKRLGALRADVPAVEVGRQCERCRVQLGRVIGAGALCSTCNKKVCSGCQRFTTPEQNTWLCKVCHRQQLFKLESGDWFYKTQKGTNKDSVSAAEIVRMSLRKTNPMYKGTPPKKPKRASLEKRHIISTDLVTDGDATGQDGSSLNSSATRTEDATLNSFLEENAHGKQPLDTPLKSTYDIRHELEVLAGIKFQPPQMSHSVPPKPKPRASVEQLRYDIESIVSGKLVSIPPEAKVEDITDNKQSASDYITTEADDSLCHCLSEQQRQDVILAQLRNITESAASCLDISGPLLDKSKAALFSEPLPLVHQKNILYYGENEPMPPEVTIEDEAVSNDFKPSDNIELLFESENYLPSEVELQKECVNDHYDFGECSETLRKDSEQTEESFNISAHELTMDESLVLKNVPVAKARQHNIVEEDDQSLGADCYSAITYESADVFVPQDDSNPTIDSQTLVEKSEDEYKDDHAHAEYNDRELTQTSVSFNFEATVSCIQEIEASINQSTHLEESGYNESTQLEESGYNHSTQLEESGYNQSTQLEGSSYITALESPETLQTVSEIATDTPEKQVKETSKDADVTPITGNEMSEVPFEQTILEEVDNSSTKENNWTDGLLSGTSSPALTNTAVEQLRTIATEDKVEDCFTEESDDFSVARKESFSRGDKLRQATRYKSPKKVNSRFPGHSDELASQQKRPVVIKEEPEPKFPRRSPKNEERARKGHSTPKSVYSDSFPKELEFSQQEQRAESSEASDSSARGSISPRSSPGASPRGGSPVTVLSCSPAVMKSSRGSPVMLSTGQTSPTTRSGSPALSSIEKSVKFSSPDHSPKYYHSTSPSSSELPSISVTDYTRSKALRQVPEETVKEADEELEAFDEVVVLSDLMTESEDDDDIDEAIMRHRRETGAMSSQKSLSMGSRESLVSLYSNAGGLGGDVNVTGDIEFAIEYVKNREELIVKIIQCVDLTCGDTKKQRTDPYVKTYLLPDRSRASKRKTRTKKNAKNPRFNETLKYSSLRPDDLEGRVLCVSVWHGDKFGRNVFLGEVQVDFDIHDFDDTCPAWYALCPRKTSGLFKRIAVGVVTCQAFGPHQADQDQMEEGYNEAIPSTKATLKTPKENWIIAASQVHSSQVFSHQVNHQLQYHHQEVELQKLGSLETIREKQEDAAGPTKDVYQLLEDHKQQHQSDQKQHKKYQHQQQELQQTQDQVLKYSHPLYRQHQLKHRHRRLSAEQHQHQEEQLKHDPHLQEHSGEQPNQQQQSQHELQYLLQQHQQEDQKHEYQHHQLQQQEAQKREHKKLLPKENWFRAKNAALGRKDFTLDPWVAAYMALDEGRSMLQDLQKVESTQVGLFNIYKGDLDVSVQFSTQPLVVGKPKKRKDNTGTLQCLVKSAANLTAVKTTGTAKTSDPFCKAVLLPGPTKKGHKQKTHTLKNTLNPVWNETLVWENLTIEDLKDHCLELTVWDYDRLSSNEFLGGLRINLGTGCCKEKEVDFMDANGDEIYIWQTMIELPNSWATASLPLRSNMDKRL